MLTFEAFDVDIPIKITISSKWVCIENIRDGRKTITRELPIFISTAPYIIPNTGNKVDPDYEMVTGIAGAWGPNIRTYKVRKGISNKLAEFLFDFKEPDLLNLLN